MATGDKKPVVMAADRDVANGVATLGEDALLAAAQRPKAGGLYRDNGTTTVEASLAEISTLLANKAPSGYGIGEEYATLVRDTDLDTLKKGGTYYIGTGCTNLPPNTDTAWSTLHVIPGRACTQIFIPANNASLAGTFSSWIARIYNDKTAAWGEWEWVNPPMALGVEYRTTERYLGKPVYVKTVSTGTMPAASGLSNRVLVGCGVNADILDTVVRWNGTATDGDSVLTLPVTPANGLSIALQGYMYKRSVYIESNGDYSAYSGTITFAYTKKTD